MATPAAQSWWASCVPEMFTHGVSGYVDDRLADANGWSSFDVANVTCPVTVLHGSADGLMPVANARHTAAIVPGATLRIVEHLGHFTILTEIVEVTSDLLAGCAASSRD
jgi:pimeloyl-ACP methyl ester carboxylesterase